MRLLLAKGADPKLTTRDGNNALMIAAGVGYRDKNTRGTEAEALEALKVAIGAGSICIRPTAGRDRAARRGVARRRYDRAVPRRSRGRHQCGQQAGLHAARRRDGQVEPDSAAGAEGSTVALLQKLGAKEGQGSGTPAAKQKQ
jgi:hypothetical protein